MPRVVEVACHVLEAAEDDPSRYRSHRLTDGATIKALGMGER